MTYQSEWENCQPFDELAPKTWAKYRGKLPDRHGSMSDLFEMIAFAAVNDFAGVDFWDWQLEFGAALSEELDAASEYVMLGWPGPNRWGETAREYARWARRKRVKSKFAPKSMSKLKTLPAVAWTVAGMIVKGQTFLLYGQRKAGKTFAAIDLGLCIATGRDYHGCKVTQGRVLHVLGEGNEPGVRNRVWAWIQLTGKDDAERRALSRAIEKNWQLVATPVQLDDPAALGEFLGVIGTGWALVIIDPLLRHTAGDTNSQRDASAFIDACATVGHATGAAVLIVHHSGKDQSRGAMGSTAYEAAVDGAATLTGEGDGPRTLQITLMRDTSANQPPLVFELVRVEAEPTFEDGEPPPIASAAFRLVASADKAKAGQSALDRLLVAAHASDNPTGESLAATLGVRFTALSRPAKRARELGYMGGNDYRLTTKGREFVVTLS